jgi:hypothetical protein
MIKRDGTQVWYLHGQLHRVDAPAMIERDGTQVWYLHGQLHRVAGPALIYPDGRRYWCQHGELHRVDGPAGISADGRHEWYVQDQNITAEVLAWMGANSITWPFNESQQVEFALRWL